MWIIFLPLVCTGCFPEDAKVQGREEMVGVGPEYKQAAYRSGLEAQKYSQVIFSHKHRSLASLKSKCRKISEAVSLG